MAKVKNNNFTRGITGKVGTDMVFRQINGKTFLGLAVERKAPFSEKQLEVQLKFKEAVVYASNILLDANSKLEYDTMAGSLGKTAHNVAVTDFLNAPEISRIDLSGYAGKIGDKITVRATDDFKVTGVTVAITNPDGTVVETGDAVALMNGVDWEYTAKATNATYLGDKIKATATDKPGNKSSMEQTI